MRDLPQSGSLLLVLASRSGFSALRISLNEGEKPCRCYTKKRSYVGAALLFFAFLLIQESPTTEPEGPRPDVDSSPSAGLRQREHGPRDLSRRDSDHAEEQSEISSRRPFAAAPHRTQDEGHAGSAVLIVVLTLALATLIFRRIYLAQEYKFDYEL